MPRDTVRHLSDDLERILIAGAHLAAGHPGLARTRTALEELAGRLGDAAPAIAQLVTAISTTTAGGPDAVRNLVGLATMAAQVRAAQSRPAPAPALRPRPPRPASGSPCNTRRLGALRSALTGGQRIIGIGLLREAAEGGDIADLRLFEDLVRSLDEAGFTGEGDGVVADQVANQAIPRVGPVIAPLLEAALQARRTDTRLLRALVAVDPEGGRRRLRQLLAGGAAARTAALDTIVRHFPGDPAFEAPLLALIARAGGKAPADALRALAGAASDASFAALDAALGDERTAGAAIVGMGGSRHPRATDRLLELLAGAIAADPAATVAADPATGPSATRERVDQLLAVLARRPADPRIAAAAMPLIARYGDAAAVAALASADARQLATLADHLLGREPGLFVVAAEAAARLGPDEAFTRLSAALTAADREVAYVPNRLGVVTMMILSRPADARWIDLCLGNLDAPPTVARFAIHLLGVAKEHRALAPLLARIGQEQDPDVLATIIAALGAIGDPACLPAILAHLESSEWSVGVAVQQAVVAIDHPGALGLVRAIHAGLADPSGHEHFLLRGLLQHLERRFPAGRATS